MIATLVYALLAIIIICGFAWLVVYIMAAANMSDPPYRGVRIVVWLVAAVLCLLVLVRLVAPALPPLMLLPPGVRALP